MFFKHFLKKLDGEQCDQIMLFLHFGQPFKGGGNNYFTQIAHIVSQFS